MKKQDKQIDRSRRTLVKGALSGIAVISMGALLPSPHAGAAHHEKAKLDENDPKAKALGYKHDAAEVDTAKFSKRAGEQAQKQYCRNCNLYREVEGGWGKCSIFPGKVVAAEGWCNAWVGRV